MADAGGEGGRGGEVSSSPFAGSSPLGLTRSASYHAAIFSSESIFSPNNKLGRRVWGVVGVNVCAGVCGKE